jgi:small GTP-binding protein
VWQGGFEMASEPLPWVIFVGKMSAIKKRQGTFDLFQKPPIGSLNEKFNISVAGANVNFLACDISGQETYRNLVPLFLHKAVVGVVAYSITEGTSFKDVQEWVMFIRDHKNDLPLILVRNKIDLSEGTSDESVRTLAEELNFDSTFDTSVVTGEEIEDLFHRHKKVVAVDHLRE